MDPSERTGETRWRESFHLRLPPEVRTQINSANDGGGGGFGRQAILWRVPMGALLIAVSIFMLCGVRRVRLATNFVDFFPARHPNVALYERFQRYGGAQTVAVMIEVKHGDIFNFATLNTIQAIQEEVNGLHGVNHNEVFSLASPRVSYVRAVAGGLENRPYMSPRVPQTAAQLAQLKQLVIAHHDALGYLVSRDYRATLITAAFNERHLDYRKLFDGIQAIVRRYRDADEDIYVAGEPIVRGYGYYYLPWIALCFATAVLAMVALLYLSLGHRSRWWAPLVTGSLSAVWGLGFVGWMNYNFDPVMLVIPFILTARDLSHGIQWQGRYYNELDACHDKYMAIVLTTNYMLPPGLLSIVADIAGIIFVSLGGIPLLHHIGLAGAVWLASSLTMVFVFEPIFLSFSPVPRIRGASASARLWEGWVPRGAKQALARVLALPTTAGPQRGAMLGAAATLLLLGLAAGMRADIGYSTPGTPLYGRHAPVNRDLAAISAYFPIDEAWVVLQTPAYPNRQSVLGPDVLRLVDDLRSYLLFDPHVRQVISFASTIIRPSSQMFHNAHPKFDAIPPTVGEAGNLWYLFLTTTAPGEMERFISRPEARDTCVRILLSDHTFATLNTLSRELNEFFAQRRVADPQLNRVHVFYLGGIAGLYAAANDVLFELDVINISFVLIVVFVFSLLAFRSVTAGFLFVLSCVLANFAAFIYMHIRGIGLTIDTLPVISLGIGLGVDYGIYVVARIQDEVRRGLPMAEAINVGVTATGAAVFSTFSVMVGGILPWAFSPLRFHSQMSVLLSFLMLTNMLVGVLVLPAFIAWSRVAFIRRYERSLAAMPELAPG